MDVSGNIEVKLAYNSFYGEVGDNNNTSVTWINSARLVAEIMCCIRNNWPYKILKVRMVDRGYPQDLDGF